MNNYLTNLLLDGIFSKKYTAKKPPNWLFDWYFNGFTNKGAITFKKYGNFYKRIENIAKAKTILTTDALAKTAVSSAKEYKKIETNATKEMFVYEKTKQKTDTITRNYQRTEERTIRASAHSYRREMQIQSDKETFPFVERIATLDNNTTKQCRLANGLVFRIDGDYRAKFPIPGHWNCRCTWRKIAHFKSNLLTPESVLKQKEIEYKKILVDTKATDFETNFAAQGMPLPPNNKYDKIIKSGFIKEVKFV